MSRLRPQLDGSVTLSVPGPTVRFNPDEDLAHVWTAPESDDEGLRYGLGATAAATTVNTTSRTASERVADVGVAAAKEREATRAPGVLAPLVDRVWAASDQFVGGGRRVSADEVVEVVQVTQGALGLFARTKPGQATP